MSDEKLSAEQEMLREVATRLGEHFDSVGVFVTRQEEGTDGGTLHVHWLSGNRFATYGQIRSWLERWDEFERMHSRGPKSEG